MNSFVKLVLLAALVTLAQAQSLNPDFSLTVKLENSGDRDGTYTLGCNPTTGNHPRAQSACDNIIKVVAAGVKPFAASSGQMMCTMQYGGPDKATVNGKWAGAAVNSVFTRRDGCEINRWNTLSALFTTN